MNKKVLKEMDHLSYEGGDHVEIRGITNDSRKINKMTFCGNQGFYGRRSQIYRKALENGASALFAKQFQKM